MNTTKHTPGPWIIPGTDGGDYVICRRERNGKRRTLAHAYMEADARLIAAAPQMLEALRSALDAMGDYYDATDAAGEEGANLHDIIAAAITAAIGKEVSE